ncbi:uncharacterized protein [Antedon mediterranea]|uniref:uncharacterized protein n=1 Tax=Antedon mediterranea TaxID=105859 RepID=UPI003AF62D06
MFSAVHGHNEAQNILYKLVIKPFQEKEVVSDVVSILLIGPAGCGKSYLVKALADELKGVASYHHLHSSSIIGHSHEQDGQTKYLRNEISSVVASRPSIFFVDDLASEDAMFPCAFTSQYGHQLAQELTKLKQSEDSSGVVFIAATQSPWNMNQHLWQLFDVQIYLQNLSFDERFAFLQNSLQDITLEAGVVQDLATRTEQYTGADLSILCQEIGFIPIRILMATSHFKETFKNGKFTACSPSDEGAIEMKLEDIAEDDLEFEPISTDAAIERLHPPTVDWQKYKLFQDTRPTLV